VNDDHVVWPGARAPVLSLLEKVMQNARVHSRLPAARCSLAATAAAARSPPVLPLPSTLPALLHWCTKNQPWKCAVLSPVQQWHQHSTQQLVPIQQHTTLLGSPAGGCRGAAASSPVTKHGACCWLGAQGEACCKSQEPRRLLPVVQAIASQPQTPVVLPCRCSRPSCGRSGQTACC